MSKKHKNASEAIVEPRFLTGYRPYAGLLLLAVIIYTHTLFFGFTYLDDNTLILDNFHFLGDMSNFFKAFQRDVFLNAASEAYYRPLMTVSLMVDARFGGTSPFFYHLTNILLHFASSCLIFVFLRRLGYEKFPVFLCSAFFAVHPALCQAVAWIPGRNDSLLAVFIVLSFIFFIDYIASRKQGHLAAHLLFFTLALFTKETAVALLILCPFYMLLIAPKRIFAAHNLTLFLGWAATVCVWFILRKMAFSHPIAYTPEYMLRSLVSNLPAVFLYIGKLLFPFNLSVLPILRNNTLIYGYAAVASVLILFCFSKNTSRSRVAFGMLWFLIFLLPGFIRPNPDLPADFIEHRMYVPALGLLIFLLETARIKDAVFGKNPTTFLAAGILGLFSFLNISHSGNFKDSSAFWENAAAHSPQYPLARRNLGAMYYLKGETDKAEKEYLECVKLNPAEPMVHNNLGLIYMDSGRLAKAEAEFLSELRYNPNYDTAYYNLGLLYARQGKMQQAVGLWMKTLEINPHYFGAYNQLGIFFYNIKDFKKAAFYVSEAQKRNGQILPELLKAMEPFLIPRD
ncbi:MAG: tetratricopeptide repeat protein [bacterium]